VGIRLRPVARKRQWARWHAEVELFPRPRALYATDNERTTDEVAVCCLAAGGSVARWEGLLTEPELTEPKLTEPESYRLPNGEDVVHRHRYETDFLYREIFVDRVYLRHGITLAPDANVVDVGGNIGLFSLFVKLECPTARVYVFEPARELFRLAQLNLRRYGADIRLFPVGLSDSDRTLEFTYYPGYSILSGFHAAPIQDRELLARGVRNQLQAAAKNRVAVSQKMVDALVGKKLEGAEKYTCQMTSLSSFLRREGLKKLDLLKIDAEKCELEILNGISSEDWAGISQIVVEAHDRSTAAELEQLLRRQGLRVVVEQEGQFAESEIYNLYARREA
jgi:FkbM family methyltransferase